MNKILSGEDANEVGGGEGSQSTSDGQNSLKDTLGQTEIKVDGVYFSYNSKIDGWKVDEWVSEVEGGEGNADGKGEWKIGISDFGLGVVEDIIR